MENLMTDIFSNFLLYCQLILRMETGKYNFPTLIVEIFLKFSHFLKSLVLSRSATPEATRAFSYC